MAHQADRQTWLTSDRFVARRLAQPIARFLHVEAAGGIVLVVATVVALVWANSPWKASYETLWGTEVALHVGDRVLVEDLRHWVGDGLMVLFFFVVGLEIKQELVRGQLASVRAAAVPAIAALGGMVVPAGIYAAINAGGDGAAGWGIPMATDIAFAVGVLALLGDRIPQSLKVLLLSLAIVDDIGAIAVIAAFYTDDLELAWLGAAVAGLVLVAALGRVKVRALPVYVAVGVFVWFATLESGIHATIAGVALGLLAPARPFLDDVDADRIADELSSDHDVTAAEVRSMSFRLRESVPVTERLQDVLHPWTSFVIIPVFALANAGVEISADTIGDAVSSPVALGILVGLVVGKAIGVSGAIAIATRLGVGRVPDDVSGRHLGGMAGLAGIGFTVSLFIAGLAFGDEPALEQEAKLGILAASVVAAVLGSAVLAGARRAGRT